ncbi:MAG: hypothetical protein K2Q09_10230, partial [Phycisphaerales bacterium]|nr:hypothetical protein [Phycisphaerales bacterium]
MDAKAGVQKVAYTSRLVTGLRCVVVAEGGVDAAVAVYRASPGVRYANADYLRTVAAQETPWGVARIGAPQQWQMGRGSSVRVADLDTGMDLEHPDLPAPVATVSFTGEPVQDGHGWLALPIEVAGHATASGPPQKSGPDAGGGGGGGG